MPIVKIPDTAGKPVLGVDQAKTALRSMATPEFNRELKAQINSRKPLVYLVTNEEKRVIEYFRQFAVAGNHHTFVWDCYNGLLNVGDMTQASLASVEDVSDPELILDWIVKEATTTHESDGDTQDGYRGNIYIMLDFHRFLKGCTPPIERRLRTLARMNCRTTVILVAPTLEMTAALDKDISVLDFPFPNPEEIKTALTTIVESVVESNSLGETAGRELERDTKEREDDIVRSVGGLTLSEIDAALSKSIVLHRRFDIDTIVKEKQQVIRKTGVLEYYNSDVGVEDVGGLSNLTNWLRKRKKAFEIDAKDYGLPTPKGILIFGIPGTGKSLSAKACAKEYGVPLLRLDFGSLFGSYIGDSERNARSAIKMAEAIAPAVLWCDEIEKGLSGMQSSGRTDSGVTARVLSTFLTWMQEKTAPVFVIATANNAADIPPEFMRAGRFDEIFFTDLPNREERAEIFKALIRRKKRDIDKFHLTNLVSESDGFTGAEIEKAIDLALFDGYDDGQREITTADISKAFKKFQPISKMQPEMVARLQSWAAERCVKANSPEVVPGGNITAKKQLDLT